MARGSLVALAALAGLALWPLGVVAQHHCQPLTALLKEPPPGALPPGPAPAPEARPMRTPERKQLELLETIGNQLAGVVRRKAALLLCADDNVNAFAAVVRGQGVIGIDVALLELLKYDRDAIAFVLSHEYAHLLLGHSMRRGAQADAAEAAAAGEDYERRSGRRGVAVIEALRQYDAKRAAYSRAQETAADDTGYQLMLEAGFNPAGALNASRIMLVTNGDAPFDYFASHPGWEDRVNRIRQVVRFDVERKEVAERSARRRQLEAGYVATAHELLEQRRWGALSAHVKAWQAAVEDSGAAWYFLGMRERSRKDGLRRARDAFERALALEPDHGEALYMLCVTLHELGERPESAYCARDLNGAALYGKLVAEQFGSRIWTTNPPPALPEKLWLVREPQGSTLITNDESLIERRGLERVRLPPERQRLPWHPR